jgi:hypothetical protein
MRRHAPRQRFRNEFRSLLAESTNPETGSLSSPRQSRDMAGVIRLRGTAVGPLRLPDERADVFIHQFNFEYARLGLKIEAIRAAETRLIAVPPPNSDPPEPQRSS